MWKGREGVFRHLDQAIDLPPRMLGALEHRFTPGILGVDMVRGGRPPTVFGIPLGA